MTTTNTHLWISAADNTTTHTADPFFDATTTEQLIAMLIAETRGLTERSDTDR